MNKINLESNLEKEFQTVGKAMGNHSTIITKNAWQFPDNEKNG